jgi:uncharacterized protein (DUF362 family)
MTEKNNEKIQRREFIARASKAGISIAAAVAACSLLYDSAGPSAQRPSAQQASFPDFSIPPQDGKTIGIVKGFDRKKTIRKAIELLGGIERFVKTGETVVIKPNVAFASPAILGATSHPDLITELVRLCYEKARAKKVYVVDNPINAPASCFSLTGIGEAATRAGAKIILPKPQLFKNTTLAGGALIKDWPVFIGPFEKADKLIGVAPLKDHHRSGASMTIKNFYGLLGGRRNIFHQDINTIIAELAMMVKPTFVILDATEVMMTNGPTGGSLSDLKRSDTLIASCDPLAADSFGCSLLGLEVTDLPYLQKAEKAGAGTTDYESLKPKFARVS